MCAKKSLIVERSYEKQSGNETSRSFASQTQPTPERIAFSVKVIRAWVGRVWLYVSVNCSASFHDVRATCCLFSFPTIKEVVHVRPTFTFAQLSNHLAWFVNGTSLPCTINQKTWWPVYKLVAYLQTGQAYSLFALYIFRTHMPEYVYQGVNQSPFSSYSLTFYEKCVNVLIEICFMHGRVWYMHDMQDIWFKHGMEHLWYLCRMKY